MLWATYTLGVMSSIQKDPMPKLSEFRNSEYTYALCVFEFHNPDSISSVILSNKWTSLT